MMARRPLRRFLQVGNRRRALVVEAVAWLLLARLALMVIPFPRLARRLGTFVVPADARASQARSKVSHDKARLAEDVGWAVTRAARHVPFNRMFRYRMAIDDVLNDFLDHAASQQGLAPSGFVFHMSRCGSTLVAQMLAALPVNVMLSEAAPINAVVQLGRVWPGLVVERHLEHLIAMVAAYGRKRSGGERHYFIKLDSWHTLALPLFRRAFPSVP